MSYSQYQSPFSDRYGNQTLRKIWSEKTKRAMWRQTWIQLLKVQVEVGLFDDTEEASKLHRWFQNSGPSQPTIYSETDYIRALELEKQTKHDLVADLMAFREVLPPYIASRIHLGTTSSDIIEWVDEQRIVQSLKEVEIALRELMRWVSNWGSQSDDEQGLWIPSMTHLQPAGVIRPSQRIFRHRDALGLAIAQISEMTDSREIQGRGIRGPDGSSWILRFLIKNDLNGEKLRRIQTLGIPGFHLVPNVGQTSNREFDYLMAAGLAHAAAIIAKIALDIRLLEGLDHVKEVKLPGQVASSVIISKTNPARAEKATAMCRKVSHIAQEMWGVAASQMLERSLDDSSSRRSTLPELFLALHEAATSMTGTIKSIRWSTGRQPAEFWKVWLPPLLKAYACRQGANPMIVEAFLAKDLKTITYREFARKLQDNSPVKWWDDLGHLLNVEDMPNPNRVEQFIFKRNGKK